MLKSLIQKSPIYPFVRGLYHRLLRPEVEARKQRMGAFYSQFFQPGDVVFDVGANQGEYAEVFASEGAKVIAIEPNDAYVQRLNAISRTLDITPAFVAVGSSPGEALLNVCSLPIYSTLIADPVEWSAGSPDYDGVEWTAKRKVEVCTLSNLKIKFGTPAYIKIDIEGFEVEALKGMDFTPSYLSFEFGARRKALGVECLEILGKLGYHFRPIVGRNYRFATPGWMTLEQALAWLAAFNIEQAEYGDMFCVSHEMAGDGSGFRRR